MLSGSLGGSIVGAKGPKRPARPLTPEQVIDAGLELLDEVGLSRFTARALAQRLGTYPATLYWHVGNQSQLFAAIVDRVLGEIEVIDPHSVPWQQWLHQAAVEYRRVLHRHPNVGPLVGSELAVSAPATWLVERVLSVLDGAGFRGDALAHAFNTYVGSLVGWVSVELSALPLDVEENWSEAFESAVRTLPAQEFPVIAANLDHVADAVISLRWHSGAERPLDASFEAALDAWITGLASQLGR